MCRSQCIATVQCVDRNESTNRYVASVSVPIAINCTFNVSINADVFIQWAHNFCAHNDRWCRYSAITGSKGDKQRQHTARTTHTHTAILKSVERAFDITFSFVSFLNDWIVSHDILIYPKKADAKSKKKTQTTTVSNQRSQTRANIMHVECVCARALFHHFVIIVNIMIERDAEFGGCVSISLHRPMNTFWCAIGWFRWFISCLSIAQYHIGCWAYKKAAILIANS